eukprot:Skav212944  [mRNA]  locus=scaffold374:543917:546327:- [translate_table: standard]
MCRWLALVLLHEVSALEQAPSVAPAPVLDPSLLAQQLAEKPEPPTFLASATASDTREADEAESPSTTVNGEEARLRDKITQEVEDKIREHAKRKHEQEEESEQAESDSTFLIFVVLGLAAIARFLCKGAGILATLLSQTLPPRRNGRLQLSSGRQSAPKVLTARTAETNPMEVAMGCLRCLHLLLCVQTVQVRGMQRERVVALPLC